MGDKNICRTSHDAPQMIHLTPTRKQCQTVYNRPILTSKTENQPSSPHSLDNFPASELAPTPSRNVRFEHIVMLSLQRESMTLERRQLRKKPSFSVRTSEMIIWSPSLPMCTRSCGSARRPRACVRGTYLGRHRH